MAEAPRRTPPRPLTCTPTSTSPRAPPGDADRQAHACRPRRRVRRQRGRPGGPSAPGPWHARRSSSASTRDPRPRPRRARTRSRGGVTLGADGAPVDAPLSPGSPRTLLSRRPDCRSRGDDPTTTRSRAAVGAAVAPQPSILGRAGGRRPGPGRRRQLVPRLAPFCTPRAAPAPRRGGDGRIVVVLAVAVAVLLVTSPVAGTASAPAATPVPLPPPVSDVPAAFVEAWRAPSGATTTPVVAGPVVVTGEGGTVAGRDRRDRRGAVELRPRPPRSAPWVPASGRRQGPRPGASAACNDDWCSELVSLRPDAGARDRARNPDVRPGARPAGDRVAGHRDRLELPRGVPLGSRGDRPSTASSRRRARSVAAAPRPAVHRLRGDRRPPRGAAELPGGERTERLTVVDPDGAEADSRRSSSPCSFVAV